jgi:hypothetical protein
MNFEANMSRDYVKEIVLPHCQPHNIHTDRFITSKLQYGIRFFSLLLIFYCAG